MTRLELVQRLCRKAGLHMVGPTTTIGQTGQFLQAVEWVDEAYRDIQNAHPDWQFLRTDMSFSTDDASVILPEFGSWVENSFRCYLTATGTSDETFLTYIPWDTFRDHYYYGSSRADVGRPSVITIKPNESLLIWPTADATYTVIGEYYMRAQEMVADADEPIFASDHMAIVWKALANYGSDYSDPDKFSSGTNEYRKALTLMEIRYLPSVEWA